MYQALPALHPSPPKRRCLPSGTLCPSDAATCTSGDNPACCPNPGPAPPTVVSPAGGADERYCNCLPFDQAR